ncbi:MAG: BlaI/MecI/CopY family transcriptional regulator [Acutalibacter sp.]|nr:BlaI/MecI/CopY family transcriptional regulator [Acutalibacter sp.]
MKTELSNGEWALMKVLWESAPMTITQLVSAMKDITGWNKHTVIPMLSRLEAKGVVRHESNGRAKLFFPVLRREDAVEQETGHFLEKVFDGHIGGMFTAMVDRHALTREDLDELTAILEKAKGGKKRD